MERELAKASQPGLRHHGGATSSYCASGSSQEPLSSVTDGCPLERAVKSGEEPIQGWVGQWQTLTRGSPVLTAEQPCPSPGREEVPPPPGMLAASGNRHPQGPFSCLVIFFRFLSFENAQNMELLSAFLRGLAQTLGPIEPCVLVALQVPQLSDRHFQFRFIRSALSVVRCRAWAVWVLRTRREKPEQSPARGPTSLSLSFGSQWSLGPCGIGGPFSRYRRKGGAKAGDPGNKGLPGHSVGGRAPFMLLPCPPPSLLLPLA